MCYLKKRQFAQNGGTKKNKTKKPNGKTQLRTNRKRGGNRKQGVRWRHTAVRWHVAVKIKEHHRSLMRAAVTVSDVHRRRLLTGIMQLLSAVDKAPTGLSFLRHRLVYSLTTVAKKCRRYDVIIIVIVIIVVDEIVINIVTGSPGQSWTSIRSRTIRALDWSGWDDCDPVFN